MAARRSPFHAFALAAIAALCGFASGTRAATPTYPQDEIEAAFLYRFAGFVTWPAASLEKPVFTIAVLDDDAVAGDLERMLSQRQLKGRRARVRRIGSLDQLGDAQILFIGPQDPGILRRRLQRLAGRPVLVVTSQPDGLADGSTINFVLIRQHVRFEISLAAARRAGLAISADLLSVATHIEGPVGSDAACPDPPQVPAASTCPRLASR